jgi:hypothetical protein
MTLFELSNQRIQELKEEHRRIQAIDIQGEKGTDEYNQNKADRKRWLNLITTKINQETFDRNILFYSRNHPNSIIDH